MFDLLNRYNKQGCLKFTIDDNLNNLRRLKFLMIVVECILYMAILKGRRFQFISEVRGI